MPVSHTWLSRATRSALIVPVPETESLVTAHRRSLGEVPVSAVPTHVTVLYPFVPPGSIGPDTLCELAGALAGMTAFDCAFTQVKWFDDEILWLEPKPDEHFRALTAAVCKRFPAHRPYDGDHPDTVPHLTVADRRSGDVTGKRRIATDIAAHLPVHARIDRVRLVAGEDEHGPWRTISEFTLPDAV
ncbi:2'-5' RNA ligase family protein [Amycolatopsis pithecellobii]|uniref:2'-5' RNA ligase family protein n=1 Tax=Amycolatopsis pithecellobii TaxID=664692 RepID=A0A6N7Z196_9PSEU|nr:2'-5' RNA ligase family protein [Amycolatopsis pithecellobii]MTD53611.1 2'-5' RNA ligase family protein [Amycolatopsis pithecellobii]